MAPDASPVGLTGFNEPIVGADGYTLPATQHDVVVWLAGAAYDVVFDVSLAVVSALAAHAAAAWIALPVVEQEAAIGRRMLDSAELDPKPDTSHVAMTDQGRFGKIFRRNIGYGTLTQHGTIFVGFSPDRERLDAMLLSMAASGGGRRDRLTDFTRAVTGAYYFVPSTEALAILAADPAP